MKRILWGVLIAHAALVSVLCAHHFLSYTKKSRIVVRSMRVAPSPPPASIAPKTKKSSPSPKKGEGVAKNLPKPKKEAPASKPAEKISPDLAEMREDFSSLQASSSPSKSAPLPVPVLPQIAFQEPALSDADASYGEQIIAYLQGALFLPEYGCVRAELEIDLIKGKIVRFEVVASESQKNSDFLKKQLPEMELPCFNGKPNETFVCTALFKNL